VLEPLALRQALPMLSLAHLAAARAALEDERLRADDLAALQEANQRFHAALTSACAMPRLSGAVADLHRASARHLFAAWSSLAWQARSGEEHRAILAAVEAGHADTACCLLAEHIMAAGRALATVLHRR